jgi:hypothetical protein
MGRVQIPKTSPGYATGIEIRWQPDIVGGFGMLKMFDLNIDSVFLSMSFL